MSGSLFFKNIYNTYFLREVKDVLGIVDEYKLQKMLTYIAQSVGGAINYVKIANAPVGTRCAFVFRVHEQNVCFVFHATILY